jgi:tRNA threonylcarbamoyladenosine biosynthesis protein TsaB
VPKILSIETSTEACSVALGINGVVNEKFELAPRRHADLILPMVRSVLAEAELPLNAVDAIAFGRGPGSFTSLRIGIGVVQGLAWGAELPVVPVSSLAALAQTAYEQEPGPEISRICVATDARMQEVYSAEFELNAKGIAVLASTEKVCPPEALLVNEPRTTCGAGNGFEHYPVLKVLGTRLAICLPDCWPRAGAVCRLAAAWLEQNSPLPAAQAQPVYIRDKVAEKPARPLALLKSCTQPRLA